MSIWLNWLESTSGRELTKLILIFTTLNEIYCAVYLKSNILNQSFYIDHPNSNYFNDLNFNSPQSLHDPFMYSTNIYLFSKKKKIINYK